MENSNFSKDSFNKNCVRLTNQLWKLIPMKENGEDWEKQLDTVLNEIMGLSIIFSAEPSFLQLVSKLQGLKISNLDFSLYRKTVFEVINLLQGLRTYE